MTELTNSLRTYAAERRARGNQAVQFNENITGWIEEAAAEIERLTKLAKEQGQEIAITRERDEHLTTENERLMALVRKLRLAWLKGADLDKDHISREALRIFVEAECGVTQQLSMKSEEGR